MENKKRKNEARERISRKQLDGLIIARWTKETSPSTLSLLQAPNTPGTQPQPTELDRLTLWVYISDLGPLFDEHVFGQSAFELYGTVLAYLDLKEQNMQQNSRIVVVSFSEDWECALALLVVFANRGQTGYLPTGILKSKPHIEKWVSEERNSPDFLQLMISFLKPEKYKDKPLPKNLHLGITRLSSPFELLREYNFKAVLNELDELNQLIQTEYSSESASTAQSIPTVNEDLTAREMIERNTWFMLNNTGDGVDLSPGYDGYEQIEEQENGRHKFWEFGFGVRQSEWAEFFPHQTWAKIRKYDAAFVEVDPKKMKYKRKNKELIDYSYYLPTKEIRKVSEQGVAKIEKSEISTKSEEHSQEAHHEETIDANPIIFESKQYRKQIKKVKGQGKNKPKVKTLASQHLQPVECAAEEVPVARLFCIEPCFIEKVFILAKPRSKRVDLKGVTREQLTNLPQVEDLRSFEVECLSKINSEDGLTKNMKRKGRKRIRKKVEEEKQRRELEINAEQESKMRMYMSLREEQINRDYGGRVMEADRYCGEGTMYEQYEHNYLDNEESKAILNDAFTQRILRMEENLEQDHNRRIIQKCEILNSLLESFDGSTIKPLLNMLYEEYEVIDEPIQVQRTSDGVSQCNHR